MRGLSPDGRKAVTKDEIEAVPDRVRTWPVRRQEEAASLLLDMEELDTGVYRLSEEERQDIRRGMAEAERGEFASDETIEGILLRRR